MLSFDYGREAYVLRGVGGRRGPVLRENRRRGDFNGYAGPERRSVSAAVQTSPTPSVLQR